MSMPTVKLHKNQTFATLFECLESVRDPRMSGKITYPLVPIIIMAICATVGGANNWVEIAYFCKDHAKWFASFLHLKKVPSHDTFNRIFNLISPKDLTFWLILWIETVMPKLTEKDIIHLDGKVLEAYSSSNPLTLVRAWSEQLNCVIGMVKVPTGSNEITALPLLIQTLYLKGKIITIDAIGAQKEVVKLINEKNADYVITLKGNQHQFYQDVKLFLDDEFDEQLQKNSQNIAKQTDKDHGRVEQRQCIVTKNVNWLDQKHEWRNLNSLGLIETISWRSGKKTYGRRYFISSLTVSSKEFLKISRSHWSIENKLHWPLDRYFEEDKSTIRDVFGSQNASFLRSIATGLLQHDQKRRSYRSIAAKRQEINRNPNLLETALLNWG